MRFRFVLSVLLFVCVLALTAPSLYAGAGLVLRGPEDKLWVFNFAPEAARGVEGVIKVSASTVYDKNQGYGWLDLKGKVATGNFGDPSLPWEGCDNLNVITRPGPDDIGRTFAAGSATFVLDLPDGKYELWMLIGDTGYLDYVPFEPFAIKVEKDSVFKRDYKPADFYETYDAIPPDDTISEGEAYIRYVKPRFEWKKAVVRVSDGQLTLQLDGSERSQNILKFSGPNNELTLGPAKRFTGALAALMVTPETQHEVFGQTRIEMIEAFRRENFRNRFPRVYPSTPAEPKLAKTDTRRGYTLFFPDPGEDIAPGTFRAHEEKTLTLRATPGESLPITFALYATNDLRHVSISPGALRTKSDSIPAKSFDVTQVRYVAQAVEKLPDSGFKWHPVPHQLVPVTDAELPKGATRQFWLTLNVPATAKPGIYTGKISVNPSGGEAKSIDLSLEVLPFTLKRPSDNTIRLVYFLPAPEYYFDDKHLWDRVRADLVDARTHNVTAVTVIGITPDDKSARDKFVTICKELALTQIEPQPDNAVLPFVFNRYTGLPNDFFDAGGQTFCLAYPGEKFSVISSPNYERLRQHLNGLAYINTLQQSVDSAPAGPAKTDGQKMIADFVPLFTATDAKPSTSMRFEDARSKLIDAILKLNPAPPEPEKGKKK